MSGIGGRTDPFGQAGADVRLEWGRSGARRAAERGDILVVVDVLSFCSTVVTAAAHGVLVFPCRTPEEAAALAARHGGEAAIRRQNGSEKGRFSLSPLTFLDAPPGLRVAVASPNGATCATLGQQVPCLIAGSLLNAGAAAERAAEAANAFGRPITVLACGERWAEPNEDGELRFALEDYLGAGAILAALPFSLTRSAEATVAERAFQAAENDLAELLLQSGSGVELTGKGFGGDVRHAAQYNLYSVAPTMTAAGYFEPGGGINGR
ncbi:MAG: 2-phosphosulfolactate phosphatase [Capsulimonadales bacterium]|nr:2-phosphosulfolactate phosphatase [Capsulimonadales bacterium]